MVRDYLKNNVLVRGAKLAPIQTSVRSQAIEGIAPAPPLQGPRTLRELMQYWAEDYEVHRRDSSTPGFRAIAVHRLGNYRMHLPKPWRGVLTLFYQPLFEHCRNHYGVELPYSAKIGRRVLIEHQGGIVIHGCAEIGDECVIRHGVTLGNRHMNAPFAAPVLGKRVNVGAGAKILGGIHIGSDASIGANAVVLDHIPAGCSAVGNPARVLQRTVANK